MRKGSVIRGPAVIGEDCTIGPDASIGPYTAVGDHSQIIGADIEDSIVVGDSVIEAPGKIVGSLIGRHASILSADGRGRPGRVLIVGENSTAYL